MCVLVTVLTKVKRFATTEVLCVNLRPESDILYRFAGYQPYLLAKEQVGTG